MKFVDFPSLIAGNSRRYKFVVNNDDGSRRDITGWTVRVTVKENPTISDSNAAITKDITTFDAPLDGELYFELTTDDTTGLDGRHQMEVQLETDNGAVYTAVRGRINFETGITNR